MLDIEIGKEYMLNGRMINGHTVDENGNRVPFICNEHVSRRIVRIADGKIYCECGRVFIALETKIEKVPYETYAGAL